MPGFKNALISKLETKRVSLRLSTAWGKGVSSNGGNAIKSEAIKLVKSKSELTKQKLMSLSRLCNQSHAQENSRNQTNGESSRFYSRRHAEALAEASQTAYPDSALQPLVMS
jgi:hypothetical protein